jgi:hypothetical protein
MQLKVIAGIICLAAIGYLGYNHFSGKGDHNHHDTHEHPKPVTLEVVSPDTSEFNKSLPANLTSGIIKSQTFVFPTMDKEKLFGDSVYIFKAGILDQNKSYNLARVVNPGCVKENVFKISITGNYGCYLMTQNIPALGSGDPLLANGTATSPVLELTGVTLHVPGFPASTLFIKFNDANSYTTFQGIVGNKLTDNGGCCVIGLNVAPGTTVGTSTTSNAYTYAANSDIEVY